MEMASLDIVAVNNNPSTLSVLLNTGSGAFAPAVNYTDNFWAT